MRAKESRHPLASSLPLRKDIARLKRIALLAAWKIAVVEPVSLVVEPVSPVVEPVNPVVEHFSPVVEHSSPVVSVPARLRTIPARLWSMSIAP